MSKLPSEYFAEQIYATFFNDRVGGKLFSWWGVDNCMWSNDYPHQNSTWPNSRAVIERDMAHLSAADRDKLLNTNVRKLYKLNAPASLPQGGVEVAALANQQDLSEVKLWNYVTLSKFWIRTRMRAISTTRSGLICPSPIAVKRRL